MRVSERVLGLLGLLGCLALAVLIAVVVPNPTTDVRRRYADAKVGELAATAVVAARVTQVRLARAAQAGESEDAWVSNQALVVVSVEASVRRQVTQFSKVSLRTRTGQDYEPRDEFIVAGLGETQPGFTRLGTLVFEVPPDRVPGAELVIDADGASFDVYAEAVRIDLGLKAPVTLEPGPVPVPESTVRVT